MLNVDCQIKLMIRFITLWNVCLDLGTINFCVKSVSSMIYIMLLEALNINVCMCLFTNV